VVPPGQFHLVANAGNALQPVLAQLHRGAVHHLDLQATVAAQGSKEDG